MYEKSMDLANTELILDAENGVLEPLAKHIEEGGYIDTPVREFLAKYLRGEIRKKPGNRRTYAQMKKESKHVDYVEYLMRFEGWTQAKAIVHCAEEMGTNVETVKTYIKRRRRERKELGF